MYFMGRRTHGANRPAIIKKCKHPLNTHTRNRLWSSPVSEDLTYTNAMFHLGRLLIIGPFASTPAWLKPPHRRVYFKAYKRLGADVLSHPLPPQDWENFENIKLSILVRYSFMRYNLSRGVRVSRFNSTYIILLCDIILPYYLITRAKLIRTWSVLSELLLNADRQKVYLLYGQLWWALGYF